jgi:polyhydroxyalkanoate synthesis regulator phasin
MSDEHTDPQQDIEHLKQRYQKLAETRTRAEANLETARTHLEELKKQAREQYGTDDIDELKNKLAQMEEENEKRATEYKQQLDAIEKDLRDVEHQYKDLT